MNQDRRRSGHAVDDARSLGLVLVKALVFWLRHQGVFWLMALPIAGLAAAIAYVLEANQALVDWRHHWGWDFLFALIFAMFLDRWIKEALLEDTHPCEAADALRGSTIALRFLVFAAALGLMATALAPLPHAELSAVLWTAAASLFALMLPALATGEPSSLRQAFALGRPLQVPPRIGWSTPCCSPSWVTGSRRSFARFPDGGNPSQTVACTAACPETPGS